MTLLEIILWAQRGTEMIFELYTLFFSQRMADGYGGIVNHKEHLLYFPLDFECANVIGY